jgi:hypothetical protein
MSDKVLFSGKTHTTNGHDGSARSSDGQLDIKLPDPHPAAENLFGAAWSACYMGALELAAQHRKVKLPAGLAVDAEIDLNQGSGGFFLRAPQGQRAWRRARGRAGPGRCRAYDLPLLQGRRRQYRGDDHPRLKRHSFAGRGKCRLPAL